MCIAQCNTMLFQGVNCRAAQLVVGCRPLNTYDTSSTTQVHNTMPTITLLHDPRTRCSLGC